MGQFGRYTIVRELGRGGMATVYLAHDPQLKRDVALKVLPRQFTHDPQFRARFKHEAEALARLDHPAIVPVYETGEVDDQPYLVMRYMPGGTLFERMAAGLTPGRDHGHPQARRRRARSGPRARHGPSRPQEVLCP